MWYIIFFLVALIVAVAFTDDPEYDQRFSDLDHPQR